jgi:FlaA1/EpsC-like NDP-sugar epimerase
MASELIRLSGLRSHIKIGFTGMRPREKLFEVLNLQDQSLTQTSHTRILSLMDESPFEPRGMELLLQDLQKAIETWNSAQPGNILKQLIPEYCPCREGLKDAESIEPQRFDYPGSSSMAWQR